MNQGIYREPGAASGLPLPRARILPLTIVVGLLALLAIGLSPMLLAVAGRSPAGAWRLFKDGGASMWLILLLDIAVPVAVAALAAFVLRGRRVPPGLLFVVAALPFGVALLGAWSGQRMVLGAISGESVDPEQKARILAEGIAESMSTDIFGGFVVCGAAIVASVAAASALATIDIAAVSRGGPKPPSFGVIGATAAGALWLLATMGLGVARARAGGIALLPVLPILVLVPFAALAARGASVLRGWHDRAEASRTAAALLVAALCALLAVLALQRGVEASFTARALEAISGESVDPSQRARILVEAVDDGRLAPAAYAIHVVLGAATFGIALVPAARSPFTPSAAAASVVALALLGGAFGLAHARTAAPRAMAARGADGEPSVNLPVVVAMFADKTSGSNYGDRMVIAKDGTGTGGESTAPSCSSQRHVMLYADRDATFAKVRARLPRTPECSTRIVLVTTRDHPPELAARLGDFAGFLGTTAYFPALLDHGSSTETGTTMHVKSLADDAIEIDGKPVALPLPTTAAPDGTSGSRIGQVVYTFRMSDTVDHAIRTIVAAETLNESRLSSWSLERVITIDDGYVPKPPPSTNAFGLPIGDSLGSAGGKSTLRPGAVQVNGRLPPEVVQRIVRQNFGRFRLCYENGLRSNPQLQGRVTVKFVIDRSGNVSTVSDGGSDLPDKNVVACIVKSFGALSFPQPEGGLVTVVYPLVFSPS